MVDRTVISDVLFSKQVDDGFKMENGYGEDIRQAQQSSLDGGKKKKMVVVKKNTDISQLPGIDNTLATKKVVVARKVRLGDTLPPLSKSDGGQSTSNSDGHTVPLSIISKAKRGPKYDSENRLIHRSVLGSVDDYLSYKPYEVTYNSNTTSVINYNNTMMSSRPRTTDADELVAILKKMSIHEKIRYLKEEKALRKWERVVSEWEHIKTRMASSRSGKDVDLLTRSECFREVMEHRELIERALALKDYEITDLSIKQNKTIFLDMKQPNREPIEVIGKPGAPRSRPSSSYYSDRRHELQDVVDTIVAFEPDLSGLSIKGMPLSRPSTAQTPFTTLTPPYPPVQTHYTPLTPPYPPVQTHYTPADSMTSLSTYAHPSSNVDEGWSPISTPSSNQHVGPMITFEGMTQDTHDLRVVCEVEVGGLARTVLHAHNVGSTAVYYAWRKLEKEKVFPIPEGPDATQRFYFHDSKGVMLPSETHSFTFGFKSDQHGIFFEKWIFESSPELKAPGPTLTLKGIATIDDDTVEARCQLEEAIGRKQILHGIQDILQGIINSIQPPIRLIPPLDDVDPDKELFLQRNQVLHLYYSSSLCRTFQDLARNAYEVLNQDKEWDLSVISLHEAIQCIHDERLRSDYLTELNSLIEQACVPRHPDKSIHYCMAYDLLINLADRMPVVASAMREGMGLPSVTFVSPEDDMLPKVDQFGNVTEDSKKAKDAKRKAADEKRRDISPKGARKKEKGKDKDEDSADEDKNPARKRAARARPRETNRPGEAPKDKEKEKEKEKDKEREKEAEKDPLGKDKRPRRRKADGEDDKKSEEEEEWTEERKTKEAEYKSELTQKVRQFVVDLFAQFQNLACEADVLSQRTRQDSFFAIPVSPSEEDLLFRHDEIMHAQEERDEDMNDDASTTSSTLPRTLSVLTMNDAQELDTDANDARARRRRRMQQRQADSNAR